MRHNCIIVSDVYGYRTVFTGLPGRWFSPLESEATHMRRSHAKRMLAAISGMHERKFLAIEEVR